MNEIQTLLTDHLDIWTAADTEKKSGRGRSSGNSGSVYGIRKLRELILELAVRGKLVPQDPNDDPASMLLEKIARKKARLIKEGVIKNEKSLPSISNEEIPFDVPGGWIWQRLGELGFTQTGGTPSKTNKEYFGNDIPFIKPGDIYPGYVDYDNEGLSNEGAKTLGRTAPAGSILMVCIGTIGKCNMIERTCSFNQQINSITPYMEMSSYLLNALGSVYFQKTAWERSSSTTIAILNKGKWVDIVVPIPPLEEQHRIVAKVDELMALCDRLEQQQTHGIEAHQTLVETLLSTLTRVASQQEFSAAWARIANHFDTLFTTEQSIDQLKQTILQLAVMGKLVSQDTKDEPASVLLDRIVKEKARLIEEGVIRKETALPEISEAENPHKIPESWEWVRLTDLYYSISPSGKKLKTSKMVDEGQYPVVDQGQSYVAGYTNDPELLIEIPGPIVIFGDHTTEIKYIDFNFVAGADGTKILRPYQMDEKYFYMYLKSYKLENRGYARHFKVLNANLMALPPLAEQHRIVAKVEELMSLCDALKARLADAQAIQLHLADAIVEQAVC